MNTKNTSKLKSAAVLVGAALVPTSVVFMSSAITNAIAGSTTQDINIAATIPTNCVFPAGGANDLDFGSYDPITTNATADLDVQTTFKITCTKGTTATLSLDLGDNASGSIRRMLNGASNYLTYELYSDSFGGTVWNATNTVTADFTSSGAVQTKIIYGRVPGAASQPSAGADLVAGSYADIVTITADF